MVRPMTWTRCTPSSRADMISPHPFALSGADSCTLSLSNSLVLKADSTVRSVASVTPSLPTCSMGFNRCASDFSFILCFALRVAIAICLCRVHAYECIHLPGIWRPDLRRACRCNHKPAAGLWRGAFKQTCFQALLLSSTLTFKRTYFQAHLLSTL